MGRLRQRASTLLVMFYFLLWVINKAPKLYFIIPCSFSMSYIFNNPFKDRKREKKSSEGFQGK